MMSSRLLPRLLQQTARRYHAEGFKPPTMDELPVPRGSWQAHHDKKQKGYNAVLAAGVGFCIFSLFVARTSGLVYLNYYPPKTLD